MNQSDFICEILKKLLLTKQQIKGDYGSSETQSIFEMVLEDLKNKFKINEKLVNELQVEFAQYVEKNKEKIIEKSSNILAEKIGKIDYYDLKNIIGGSEKLREIIEKQIMSSQKIQEAINNIVNQDFPELAKKIKEGKVEIKMDVNLK